MIVRAAQLAACLTLGAATTAAAQQDPPARGAAKGDSAVAVTTVAQQGQQSRRTFGPASPWRPRLRLDNDAYNFWIHPAHRSDEEYSNGVEASLETLRGTFWGRRLGGRAPDCGADTAGRGRCLTTTVSIGQDMYTPDLSRPPFANPDWRDERPYAGWLYLGATGRSVSDRSMRAVTMQLGVTGRPALGEVSQKVAHWIVQRYTTDATGWETQVGFQPGVQLGATQSVLAARGSAAGKAVIDLVPSATVALGTVRSAAEAAARLRVGYNLSHPFDPRRWQHRAPLEFYLSAAGRTSYVAHDFSLDGSLLSNNRHVTRVPTVREFAFGAGLRLHWLLLQWEPTTRSRQYTTGPNRHTFSTMTATWEFYR